ncbi:hypothetical protein GCM10027060_21440 [Nesterenkonia halophila]
MAAAFLLSGTLHIVRPQIVEPIVPRGLAHRRALVHLSGVAELACAVGMLNPAMRRLAERAAAALLVAVFPANVQMAVDAHHAVVRRALALTRLPLPFPLIMWVLVDEDSASASGHATRPGPPIVATRTSSRPAIAAGRRQGAPQSTTWRLTSL